MKNYPQKPLLSGTLPFDDSIPSRSELRTRGFFKTLEKAEPWPLRPGRGITMVTVGPPKIAFSCNIVKCLN